MMKTKTVVVGLSGGVDSSVAACLLKNQGYHVIGVTMQMWQQDHLCEEELECSGVSIMEDAKRVADFLEIPFYVMDFRKDFRERVIQNFVSEYRAGRTPNPCIVCNRYVKWEALLKKSVELGADYIATGHYARIKKLSNGRYTVVRSGSGKKDQTYALYSLTQQQLAHTLFPVGEYGKEKIRDIAGEAGIPVANKPDSQEICFVPDRDYAAFLERETNEVERPGNFVSTEGKVLGRHKGIGHYTIGQRKGLGIAFGEPVFVVEIRPDTNEVVLGKGKDVFTDRLCAANICCMAAEELTEGQQVTAKIRYNHEGAPAVIQRVQDNKMEILFSEPVRAVTPGQAVVLYEGDYVLGGGTICH